MLKSVLLSLNIANLKTMVQELAFKTRIFNSALVVIAVCLSGCAFWSESKKAPEPVAEVQKFSEQSERATLPKAWQAWRVTPQKNKTKYSLKRYEGRTVLHAQADVAASGLVLSIQPRLTDNLELKWQWKALSYIPQAEPRESQKDDAPLRIMVAFDGDKSKLPFKEQMIFEMAKVISGHDMPYATLMYVWASNSPLETIYTSSRTSRIKMIVVNSGPNDLGAWQMHRRNLKDDYQNAFGEPPGKVIGLGLMTDSDNTRTQVSALYGDIELIDKKKNNAPSKPTHKASTAAAK